MKPHPFSFSLSTRVRALLAALVMLCGLSLTASGTPKRQAPPDDAAMFIRSERSAALLHTGREEILEFRLARAEETFSELAKRQDGKVAGAFYLETISFLRFMMSDRDVYRDEFFARSNALRPLLARAPDSPWRGLVRAEANLHRGVVRARRGQYLQAALAGRSAYKEYVRLIKRHPDFYEAYKGLGVFHVAVGSVPSGYRWLPTLFGFGGTVEQGLRELQLAADSSGFNREEAQIYLAQIDLKLFDASGEGAERLSSLFRAYHGSPLFGYVYGEYLYTTRQAAEAERVFRTAVDTYEDGEHFYIDYVDPLLADVLFRQNRFDEAAFYYRRFLDRHHGTTMKATATLGLGLSLEMQGRRAQAVAYYEHIQTARGLDTDAVSRRRTQRLRLRPLSDRERTLLLGRNAYDAGRYDEAHDLLRAIEEDPNASPDERAEAAYRRGRAFHAQGRLDQALEAYAAAVAQHHDPLSRWGPWAQNYAGLLLETSGDTGAAQHALEAALDYGGKYDYHQALRRNAKIALHRLKKAR